MEKIKKLFLLKKEAILLDSKLYIVKSFFAVLTAYIIAKNNSILKLDTISILFGLMLTLEPVTLTGIRTGLNQLCSSIIGAACTAFIIYMFNINSVTVALAVSLTLYVCIKINWREVSSVAIFTSIYMTQYIQKNSAGVPSELFTFKLRMFALGTGVAVAIVYNMIFSILSYRRMKYRRVSFLLDSVTNNIKETIVGVENRDKQLIFRKKLDLPGTFNNIDWVYSHYEDMKKELGSKFNITGINKQDVDSIQNVISQIRGITHFNYDLCYVISQNEFNFLNIENEREKIINELQYEANELMQINKVVNNKYQCCELKNLVKQHPPINCEYAERIINDIDEIKNCIASIKQEMMSL